MTREILWERLDRKVGGDRNEEGNESANQRGGFFHMPDLPPRWDFAVFRNIFLFELEREKVRSEVWRREKELMQDIRGAIIGGSIFVFSQDNPDQVPSGNLTSI